MTVTINDQKKHVPQSWNELSLTELITIYQLMVEQKPHFFFTRDELPAFIRIEAGKYLLKLNDEFLKVWEEDCIQDEPEGGKLIFQSELSQVMQAVTGFLFNENNEVALKLTRNPYPRLSKLYRKGYFYGPADGLSNLKLYELGTTFSLFEKYLKTKDESILLRLLAVLYRPSKPSNRANRRSNYQGDRRLPYFDHESTVDFRISTLRALPSTIKGVIFFWFASCRQHIVNSYPNVFKVQSEKVERIGNDYGWGGILMSLAGGIVHLKNVGEQPWQTGLAYMSLLEDQRVEAEMNQRRRKRS